MFAAGPKLEVLAENALDDYCLSSPAVSNGQIFIRTDKFLWAIGKGNASTAQLTRKTLLEGLEAHEARR